MDYAMRLPCYLRKCKPKGALDAAAKCEFPVGIQLLGFHSRWQIRFGRGDRAIPMVIAACMQTGLSKVLIDHQDLDGELGAVQDILFAQAVLEFYKQHRLSCGRPLRIAILGLEPKPWSDGVEIVKNEGPKVL